MGLHVAPLSHKNPWRNKQAHKSGNPQLVLGERAIPRAPAFTPGLRELGPPRTIILYSSFLFSLPALAPIIPWPWTYGQALLLHRALLDISIFCSYQRKALRWPSSLLIPAPAPQIAAPSPLGIVARQLCATSLLSSSAPWRVRQCMVWLWQGSCFEDKQVSNVYVKVLLGFIKLLELSTLKLHVILQRLRLSPNCPPKGPRSTVPVNAGTQHTLVIAVLFTIT